MSTNTYPEKTGLLATAVPKVLFASAVPVSRTRSGTPSEVDTVSLSIPANTIQVGDILRIDCLYSFTSNANGKRARVKIGGSYCIDFNAANNTNCRKSISLFFGTTTSCRLHTASSNSDNGISNTAMSTLSTTIDITAAMPLIFATSMDVDADVMIVEGYLVELVRAQS